MRKILLILPVVSALCVAEAKVISHKEQLAFEAPCTVICPANVPHEFFNTGDVPTDAIAILGIDSKIIDQNEIVMELPWRH
ncbi:MAG: hypothetical protein SNF33_00595 [Candidatus Algichlamydia australiensis]|nr:hypothetical protein [Chlamydiales bacterium]